MRIKTEEFLKGMLGMLSFIVILKHLREIHADLAYANNGLHNFLDGYLHFGKDIFVIDYAIEYWHIELLYVILLIGRIIYWLDGCEEDLTPEDLWISHKRCPIEMKVLAYSIFYTVGAILVAKDALVNFIGKNRIKRINQKIKETVLDPFDDWETITEKDLTERKTDFRFYGNEDSKIKKESMTWEEVFMDSTK